MDIPFDLLQINCIRLILPTLLLVTTVFSEETNKSEIQFNHRLRIRYASEKDTIHNSLNLSLKKIEMASGFPKPYPVVPRVMIIGGYSLFACGIPASVISYIKSNEKVNGPFSYRGTIKNEERKYTYFYLFILSGNMIGGGLFAGIFGTVKTFRSKKNVSSGTLDFSYS